MKIHCKIFTGSLNEIQNNIDEFLTKLSPEVEIINTNQSESMTVTETEIVNHITVSLWYKVK